MIKWIDKHKSEGRFKSSIFHNDDDMIVYIENASLADYAEECVRSFNSLPKQIVNEICPGIVKCAEQGGINEDFELPELDNSIDILKYCWFTSFYVFTPNSSDCISYIVEGEGEWGEIIGFVIENNQLIYVGVDFLEYGT